MATHSSILAWKIPGTGEPGGLPSMGSHSKQSDSVTHIYLFFFIVFPIIGYYKNIDHSFPCYTAGPCLSILHTVVCISEKAMAPHSSTIAWKIPWTEEPGRLQSMGSHSQTRLKQLRSSSSSSSVYMENAMATRFSILAWKIPGTEEPGLWGHTVKHD